MASWDNQGTANKHATTTATAFMPFRANNYVVEPQKQRSVPLALCDSVIPYY